MPICKEVDPALAPVSDDPGHLQSCHLDEETKNRICTPIVPPTVPDDWLRMLRVQLGNHLCWNKYPEIGDWMARSRLDLFTATARARLGVDVAATEHFQRYLANIGPAISKLDQFLAEASDPVTAQA